MAIYLRIMVRLYESSCPVSDVGDDPLSILVPYPLSPLKLMRVDPSVEDVFVLIFVVSMDSRDGSYE